MKMKKLPYKYYRAFLLPLLVIVIVSLLFNACSGNIEDAHETGSRADIFPEYYDLTLPPNIAPLNFVIRHRSSTIKIPTGDWHKLLSAHAGETLQVDIWSYNEGMWYKFRSIEHHIAKEAIDPWLAYRLVYAVYLKWRKMGIYQRKLSNFDEIPVIENAATDYGCMNCHAFANNDPSRMLIHFRILHPGTLLWSDGQLSKVDTRKPNTLSAGIYPAWHPDGKHIAFSRGQISPHLTTRLNKTVDVADRRSDLVVYDLENNTVSTSPFVSSERRENMPVWSPDGRYMICSMSDFGYFTIFHKESDLYCIDLETKAYRKLELNSESAESFSSWSSNGHWLVFSSKRMDDVFSRTFIAYFDNDGHAHKPFVLPQKDPQIYYSLMANYNLPKLITGKIELTPREIRKMVLENPVPVKPGN